VTNGAVTGNLVNWSPRRQPPPAHLRPVQTGVAGERHTRCRERRPLRSTGACTRRPPRAVSRGPTTRWVSTRADDRPHAHGSPPSTPRDSGLRGRAHAEADHVSYKSPRSRESGESLALAALPRIRQGHLLAAPRSTRRAPRCCTAESGSRRAVPARCQRGRARGARRVAEARSRGRSSCARSPGPWTVASPTLSLSEPSSFATAVVSRVAVVSCAQMPLHGASEELQRQREEGRERLPPHRPPGTCGGCVCGGR
jgi:hypothetical protein